MNGHRFSDISGDSPGTSSNNGQRGGGFYIPTVTGFILLLLAVLIAVGIGIIVHFAGSKELVCHCGKTGDSSEPGRTEPVVGQTTVTPPERTTRNEEDIKKLCIEWAASGEKEICEACPEPSTPILPDTTPATTSGVATTEVTALDYRLPKSIKPIHYTLELKPNIYVGDPANFSFDGKVDIEFEVTEATDKIILHANKLDIDNSTITVRAKDVSVTAPKIKHAMYEALRHFYTLHLDGVLVVGQIYYVKMTFSGPLKQDGAGLYLSVYEDGGENVYLATTQFQAVSARKAFPCFDEPHLKANFNITLVRKNGGERAYRSLSNTDKIGDELRETDFVADIYAETPRMSTYLLAFVVCDYKKLENITKTNITYRTLARPNAIEFAHTAQEFGLEIFEKMEDYFEPEYVLNKLDNIAIPDFTAGAMENWGLITYRETMLYQPGVSTAAELDWTAEVISHEIAHMWFGDLVSPKWWGWLWLNEAFASFWDYHIVGELKPDWRMLETFIPNEMHTSMDADSLRTSHPLTADVMTPAQISSIFDAITYSKGSCIVRMMRLAMGQDHFIKGLNRYLHKYQFDVADHQNLWDELTAELVSQNRTFSMTEVMDPWVTQMNYPVVTVTRTHDHEITLKQDRFLIGSGADAVNDKALYDYKWTIPITYASSVNPEFEFKYEYETIDWMSKNGDPLVIRNATSLPADVSGSWVIVNIKQCGFFRVNYDDANWKALIEQLNRNHTIIHEINRGQIINDAWNLAKAGLVNQSVALDTISYMKNEVSFVPWRALIRELGYVESMLERTDIFGMFENFMGSSVKAPLESLGMEINDSMVPIDIYTRTQIVQLACNYGNDHCVSNATDALRNWMMDNSTNMINPNLRSTFYCTAVRNGGWAEWQFAYDMFHQVKSATEKNSLRFSLSCTKEPSLLTKLLEMSLNADEIRPQDARTTITYVSGNKWGRDLAWNFLRARYDEVRVAATSFSGMGRLINAVTAKFNTAFDLKQIEDFVKSRDDLSGPDSPFKTAIEKTKSNIEWLDKNYPIFKTWLHNQNM